MYLFLSFSGRQKHRPPSSHRFRPTGRPKDAAQPGAAQPRPQSFPRVFEWASDRAGRSRTRVPPRVAAMRTVADGVRDQRQRQRRQHVDDRMLLEEHRRQADEQRRRRENGPPQRLPQPLGVPSGEHHAQRTEHMDGRADIGVGVEGVKIPDHLREQVVARKSRRTKLLAGGENQINHNRDRVCKDDEVHKPLERADVVQHRIQQHPDDAQKPRQIRNQKQLAEWDHVVQRTVHRIVAHRAVKFLDEIEEKSVNRPEQQQLEMAKRFVVQLGQPELPVIHGKALPLHLVFSPLFVPPRRFAGRARHCTISCSTVSIYAFLRFVKRFCKFFRQTLLCQPAGRKKAAAGTAARYTAAPKRRP